MKSKRSKAMDQKYLSKKELKDGGELSHLKAIAKGLTAAFRAGCVGAFGPRWWTRLSNSAKRKKRSPMGYALDVLLK